MFIDFHIRDDILKHFPNYEYFNCIEPDKIDFNVLNNFVGQQQEAFILYWTLKQLCEYPGYGAGLDIGCGQGVHFATVGLNDYYGKDHPVYRGKYLPHITALAENVDKIFNDSTFNFIIASHILEHVNDPILTFRKWCKLLRKSGIVILLMPDNAYEKSIGSWDLTHKTFWYSEDFEKNCILLNQDIIKMEEFNNLKNKFSMNFIGRRI